MKEIFLICMCIVIVGCNSHTTKDSKSTREENYDNNSSVELNSLESGASLEKELQQLSNHLNSNSCPMVVDEYTTLKNTVVQGNNFIYLYGVKPGIFKKIGVSKSDWIKSQTKILRNAFCTVPDFKWFRENNITLVWNYMYLDGSYLAKIEANIDDCL